MVDELKPNDRAWLREFLSKHFTYEDLEILAFDLGIKYKTLPHQTLDQLTMGLISYFESRGGLNCLVAKALSQRQDKDLAQLLAKLPAGSCNKKVQIIIASDIPIKDEHEVIDIISELAKKLKIPASQVEVISAAWDSLRLLLGLPQEAVDILTGLVIPIPISTINHRYRIVSITVFESLDTASQKAWLQLTLHNASWPPALWNGVLRPSIGNRLRKLLKHSYVQQTIEPVKRSRSATGSVAPVASMATQANRLKQFWAVIVGIATISGIIGVLIGYQTLRQAEQAAQASDVIQVTVIALMKAQLSVQQEIATAQANPVPPGPTTTAVAERVIQLIATQDALQTARQRLEATQTAMAQPTPTGNSIGATASQSGTSATNAISYGQILSGTISAPTEVDRYPFTGHNGDLILIKIAKASGEFHARTRLLDPNGKLMRSISTWVGVSAELTETLPDDGEYIILVDDDLDGTKTGEYVLNLQKVR